MPYACRASCPEKISSLASRVGVAVLDAKVVDPMYRITGPNKRVDLFPDFTDTTVLDFDRGIAAKVRGFAAGRKIISLVGHPQRTKGLLELTAAAASKELNDAFFFSGGESNLHEVSVEQKRWLLQTWEESASLYTHLQRLSRESALDAVINASGIIFAVYTDFPNSSNIMTKSALYHRPVLVSDGQLMVETVRTYALGEVVPEGDIPSIVNTEDHVERRLS